MATLTLTPLTNILEGVAFFQGFASEELDLLLDVGKWTQVAPHERIVQQGEQDLHMYVLVQGQAEVIYNEKVVATIKSGDIFGEIGLMGRPRIAHVESSRECLLLAFDANDLNKLPLTLQVKFLPGSGHGFCQTPKIECPAVADLPGQNQEGQDPDPGLEAVKRFRTAHPGQEPVRCLDIPPVAAAFRVKSFPKPAVSDRDGDGCQ